MQARKVSSKTLLNIYTQAERDCRIGVDTLGMGQKVSLVASGPNQGLEKEWVPQAGVAATGQASDRLAGTRVPGGSLTKHRSSLIRRAQLVSIGKRRDPGSMPVFPRCSSTTVLKVPLTRPFVTAPR